MTRNGIWYSYSVQDCTKKKKKRTTWKISILHCLKGLMSALQLLEVDGKKKGDFTEQHQCLLFSLIEFLGLRTWLCAGARYLKTRGNKEENGVASQNRFAELM